MPAKYFPPSAPYGSSPAANVLNPSQPAAVNPQTPLLPPSFSDPGTMPSQTLQSAATGGTGSPFTPRGGNPGGGNSSDMMRRIFGRGLFGLLVLLLAPAVWATTTVTGTLKNLGTGTVSGGAFVRFWLRGCQGTQPRVNGNAVIAPTQGGVFYQDFVADVNGSISGTVYSTRDATGNSNGEIECPTSVFTATWYGVQLFLGGKAGPETPVAAKNGATLNVTNVTPLNATPVVTAPTGDTVYLRLDGGNSPVTGPVVFNSSLTVSGTTTLAKINNTVQLDGVTNTTLATCYAAIAANGGACVVPPNYTETMAASLTMNKANAGFIFMGRADITMGTNQIIVPAGTHGVFLIGQIGYGGGDITQGARFFYSGSGNAFQVGASSSSTRMLVIKNITVNLITGATGTATGLYLTNVIYFEIKGFSSVNQSASTTTRGLVCDGTGNYCGNGVIERAYLSAHGQGLLGAGSGSNAMNDVVILDGIFSGLGNGGSPICIDIEAGNGNSLNMPDTESCTNGIKLGSAAVNNFGWVWSESHTLDVNALAGSLANSIRFMTQPAAANVLKADAGTQNNFTRIEDIGGQTYYSSAANGEATLLNTGAGTSQKFIELATTGNSGFYFGIESNVAGAFFTGSQANESVLFSPGSPNLFVSKPIRIGSAPVGVAASNSSGYDSVTGTEQHNSNNNGASSFSGAWNCTNVTPVTVSANVATDQNLMACTIPAGTLNRVGRSLRIFLAGVYSTEAANASTVRIKVKLCTVSGCGSGTVITPISIVSGAQLGGQANDAFNVSCTLTVQTAGASAAFEAHGNLALDGITAATVDSVYADTNIATVGTIDSTAQLFLQVTGTFSVAGAAAGNIFTERQQVSETVN